MNDKSLNPGRLFLTLALLVIIAAGILPPATLAAPRAWEYLPPQEKMVLEPYARQWPDLSLEKQEKLRHGARQWSRMTEKARTQARERFKQWRQLTPEERRSIRARFEQFQRLPSPERKRLLTARRWYRNQNEEIHRQLREQWQQSAP
jgi:hypothetical protein